MDSAFLRLLDANVQLGLMPKIKLGREIQPTDLVAWLVYNEARGTRYNELCQTIPLGNRSHDVDVVTDERRVWLEGTVPPSLAVGDVRESMEESSGE